MVLSSSDFPGKEPNTIVALGRSRSGFQNLFCFGSFPMFSYRKVISH